MFKRIFLASAGELALLVSNVDGQTVYYQPPMYYSYGQPTYSYPYTNPSQVVYYSTPQYYSPYSSGVRVYGPGQYYSYSPFYFVPSAGYPTYTYYPETTTSYRTWRNWR